MDLRQARRKGWGRANSRPLTTAQCPRLGDGCEERTDAGLSKFGLAANQRLNEVGVAVDVSHTGYRTTMEGMEASERPVVFSHACAQGAYGSQRDLRDDQIHAAAAS